ncbi:MAG TPA: hypothetical protein VK665_14370, partial [Candidatus Elarobacter sp.]|nr:hypothetical protein [Candidatus Elarobacter sp.]
METHRLTVEEVRCSPHVTSRGHRDVVPLPFPVDRVELFHRDEWTEQYDEPGTTIGSNPVVVRTGPVGSGPTGVQGVTVLCGIAIHAAALSPRSILIYLADHPGLISWTCDRSEIAAYRQGVTAEDLPDGSGLPRFWPLVPGGLSYDVLMPFLPIGFTALAEARSLGFLRDDELKAIVAAEGRPAPDLMIFLNTASTFDRDRDIAEELARLGRDDRRGAPPLWMILGKIIVDTYASPNDALETLEH